LLRRDGSGDHATGIHALQLQAGKFARTGLEIPPGHAVLRADDCGIGRNQRRDSRRELRQAMRFHAEEDDVHGPGFGEVADDSGPLDKIAFGANYADAALLHGTQVRAAGEERNLFAGPRHAGTNVGAYRTSAGNQELQPFAPTTVAATTPRWILPVAVRGIAVTM
jgi:hypothetical protein